MVRVVALLALTLVTGFANAQGARRDEPEPARYGWLGSLAEAKTEAQRTGKPLMVVLRCAP